MIARAQSTGGRGVKKSVEGRVPAGPLLCSGLPDPAATFCEFLEAKQEAPQRGERAKLRRAGTVGLEETPS